MNALIEELVQPQVKKDVPDFDIGDTVRVHVRIIEGDKERIQILTGTVIARKGSGIAETFSIYRVAYGASMERVFPLHSPRVAKIEVIRRGKTRRSKLYFLRGVQGKKARLAERIMSKEARAKMAVEQKDKEPVAVEELKAEETPETEKPAEPKTEKPEAKKAEPKPEAKAEEKAAEPKAEKQPETKAEDKPQEETKKDEEKSE